MSEANKANTRMPMSLLEKRITVLSQALTALNGVDLEREDCWRETSKDELYAIAIKRVGVANTLCEYLSAMLDLCCYEIYDSYPEDYTDDQKTDLYRLAK